jgi:hypothetical protein
MARKSVVRIPVGSIELEVEGDTRSADSVADGLIRAFDPINLAHNLLADNVAEQLRQRIEQRFASEGDELTGPWQELGPYTQEMRAAGGFGPAHPINVRTGAMKRHLLREDVDAYPHSLGATMYLPSRGAGTPAEIEKVTTAQMGDPKTRTPARPVLALGVQDMELILLAIGVHIAEYQGGGQGIF